MRKLRLSWTAAALLVATTLASPSNDALATPKRQTPRQAVEQLLMGIEYVPTAEELKRLSTDVDRTLIDIASDGKSHGLARTRAVYALGLVPSLDGRRFLQALLVDKREARVGLDLGLLKAAARTVGVFGTEAAADLLPLVDHPVAQVRSAVAAGLARTGSPHAHSTLEQMLVVERDHDVRQEVARVLVEFGRR